MVCKVGFVVYEGLGLLDVVGPSDVFTTANQLADEQLYETIIAAVGCSDVRAESGIRIAVDVDLAKVPADIDTLIVAGGLGFRAALGNSALLEATGRAASSAGRISSVCTGAFLLAEIGLLDGRRATTHWDYAADLASEYPQVDVVSDELYVSDGPVTTAAGVAAGIDLALAMVEADHGVELARSVSRRMVIYLRRTGGQSQFSERSVLSDPSSDSDFESLLVDLAAHPSRDWSVERMATAATMSRRHFARVFRDRTGTTPARWLERVRVDAARERLDQSDDSVERVAEQSGFRSVHTMRQSFQRVMGVSPTHYRTMHNVSASGS
jgi:transcriptional regulator GlxA family with amidase domain